MLHIRFAHPGLALEPHASGLPCPCLHCFTCFQSTSVSEFSSAPHDCRTRVVLPTSQTRPRKFRPSDPTSVHADP